MKDRSSLRLRRCLFPAACCVIFLAGCQNPLEPSQTDESRAETGTLSLTIGRQDAARTILPEISLDIFVRFDLTLNPSSDCDAGNMGFSVNFWQRGDPVYLAAGIWDLSVDAFTDSTDGIITAQGNLSGFQMRSGETTGHNVSLYPIVDDVGTFSWRDIHFPESVLYARMEIAEWIDWSVGAILHSVNLVDQGAPVHDGNPYRTLTAGQYFVIFTLYGEWDDWSESRKIAAIGEILHVYRNLETKLPPDSFADFVFPVPVLSRVLETLDNSLCLVEAGVTWRHFDFLVDGVDENNFSDIADWLGVLVSGSRSPINLYELKALVDAARIGMAGDSIGAYGHTNWEDVEGIIRELVANNTEIRFEWASGNVVVTVFIDSMGVYVEIVFDQAVLLDKTELGNVITAAQALLAGTMDSVNGSDLDITTYWVTTEVHNTFDAFIIMAQGVYANNAATQAQVDAVREQLADAVATFEAARRLGTGGLVFIQYLGGYAVFYFTGMSRDVVIPAVHNGLPVVAIGSSVFAQNQLTSVTIPDSVTSIGDWAFASNQLSNVTIPNNVTTIGTGAFTGNQLSNVTIGYSVTSIGGRAFAWNQLTSVTIPNSVTSIGDWAFVENHLTSVTIPNNVTSIGTGAFMDNQLSTVTIGNSVTSIGEQAFLRNQLTNVIISNSVTSIGNGAFAYNQLTSVVIPDSVTSIGSSAFAYNQLTSVVIPDSVMYIGWQAFAYNQLTSATIGSGVTSIAWNAFAGHQLTNVTLGMAHIADWFAGTGSAPGQLTSVTILDSVTSIEDSAFAWNQLTSVTIGNGVTSIGRETFAGNQLTSVTIPGNVMSIGCWAFAWNQLISVTIGNGVTTIGDSAFVSNQLTSVAIPDNVTSIGFAAFENNQLTSITIGNGVTTIGQRAFDDNQLTIVTIPNSVTTIGHAAFRGNNLSSVTIGNSVTTIGDLAFRENQLTSITIPESVTSIGDHAFGINQLTSVTIPGNVTTIGQWAFGINQLTSVTIPSSVTTIGDSAFAFNHLTSVIIPFASIQEADTSWGMSGTGWRLGIPVGAFVFELP